MPPDESPLDAGSVDAPTPPPPPTPAVYAYAPGSVVAGKTIGEWSAAWWEWVLAIPHATNPILSGPCNQFQPGGVFFLAGNSGGAEERDCVVPANTPLLFPILNVATHECLDFDQTPASCQFDAAWAKASGAEYFDINAPSSLAAEIDGVRLDHLDETRVASPAFTETEPADATLDVFPGPTSGPIHANVCGVPVGSKRTTYSDGYWVMLRPLAPGPHVLHFAGADALPFSLDITYHLTVRP